MKKVDQTMPPSSSALAVYFFCNRNQKNKPPKPRAMTAILNGELIGTRTASNVHSMNFATGVMISCVFMGPKFGTKISNR